jgi:hypothetical protein
MFKDLGWEGGRMENKKKVKKIAHINKLLKKEIALINKLGRSKSYALLRCSA